MSHVVKLFSKNRRFHTTQCHLGAFACHLKIPTVFVASSVTGAGTNSRNPLPVLIHQALLPLFQTTANLSSFMKSFFIRGLDTQRLWFRLLSTPTECAHPQVVCTCCKDSFKLWICLVHVLIFLCLHHCCLRQQSSKFDCYTSFCDWLVAYSVCLMILSIILSLPYLITFHVQ